MASDADLLERLTTEADLCRNETADDIASLLDEAAALIRRQQQQFEQACGLLERAQQDAGWYDAESFLAEVRGSSGQTRGDANG